MKTLVTPDGVPFGEAELRALAEDNPGGILLVQVRGDVVVVEAVEELPRDAVVVEAVEETVEDLPPGTVVAVEVALAAARNPGPQPAPKRSRKTWPTPRRGRKR